MLKVLFIDDQVEVLKPILGLVRKLLRDVEILAEGSGSAGLERAQIDKPDMIFLDIAMPGMDGYEVCRRLQASPDTQSIPILFLTSLDLTMQEQLDAFEHGAIDFLRKPIHSVELATRIRVIERLNNYTQHLEELVAVQTRKIEKQQAIASRTQRLAAMGTLAAGIAHEINQPLNALKVTADGLLYWKDRNEEIGEEEVFDGLRFISRQCSRIEAIINNMRDLVQESSTTELTPVDVHLVIEQALALIGVQMKYHEIEVVRKFDDHLPPALGSQTPLEQVLLNLFNNSLTALDRSDRTPKRVIVTTYANGSSLCIEVEDTGPGIPEEEIESIFDPFYTTPHSTQGMGLGLSITQNLVASMKGTLTIKNSEQGGAVACVTLPLAGQ